jgi:lipoprotein-anchoring transpeptidase ErfK/SrfK
VRVRPSLLLLLTGLTAVLAAQTALAATGAPGEASGLVGYASGVVLGEPGAQPASERAGSAPAEAAPAVRLASARVERPRPRRASRAHGLARVRAQVAASARPGGPATGALAPTTEFGSPQVVGVAARRGDWLGVVAAGRPNGRLAWVRRDAALDLRRTRWSLHADLSERSLELRRGGRVAQRLTVAIGRPGSHTPTGRFAVTDKLEGARFGPYYGCCILALSGIQPNTPPGWTGGNRLAIHGTDAPSTIGAASSAGCLRAGDDELRGLMAKVPLGTLVFIRA